MVKMKRSRSYTQQVHHYHHTTTNTINTNTKTNPKTLFFPNFCRLSLNDIIKPSKLSNLSSSSSLSASSSSIIDPSSPKISCIGQIKNRSSSTTPTSSHKSSGNSYTKLRKLFSSKNLIISAPSAASNSANNYTKCLSNRNRNNAGVTVISDDKTKPVIFSVEELDPPLPVVKFCDRQEVVNVDLKRRRGIELKTLQIQPFQLLSTTFDTGPSNHTAYT